MLFRVRLDLSFASEADAKLLMAYAKKISSKATTINEGQSNEEIAFAEFIDHELCRHDEGGKCTPLERVEVRGVN